MGSSDVTTVSDVRRHVLGVAFDWVTEFIYLSAFSQVMRSHRKGSEVKTALNARECKRELILYMTLAFEWVTGNIFIVTERGLILACDGRQERPFACATVVEGQGKVKGIAVNPIEG